MSSLSDEERRSELERFKSYGGSEKAGVKVEDFRENYQKVHGAIAKKEMTSLLNSLDANGDGVITWEEYLADYMGGEVAQ
ncbi:EF-hand domain pair [Pseudomonas koreensis]|uniref:EF-hand domain-containing protein n=1 Tax=Pseudomonas koreensis TaxID=198620 RepID=UPI00087BDB41|nr:EF-hand domain-containing protein [Pseudomonas koreensis]NNA60218.1 EF-hand domain-containing protein [Pseudomonas koreensis]GGK17740.1 hypothetical protein GCM10009103_11200 [Pseudomonas koreensis]SDD08473.1 EF-hand domain pair [Pseudomonas koreensis]